MARPSVLMLVACLASPLHVFAAAPATQPALSQAAKIRARNYFRPGWFLVDGNWARGQAKVSASDLFTLIESDGSFHLWANPAPRFDPFLKNGRTGLIELDGSAYAWKVSAAGRVWDDTRSAGSQHLQLVAAMDDARAGLDFRLTKIDISPDQQTIQAVVMDGDKPTSVIVVLGRDFIECTAGPFGGGPAVLARSSTGRQLLIDRPVETRQYVAPLLRLVNDGKNPLTPAAADVYRAFPNLPLDPQAADALRVMIPDLAAADPAVRERAGRELQTLGRRGVQAAMRFDPKGVPVAAADRIAALVQTNARDDRSAETLRHDLGFILDCLTDPDANVRAEAGKLVGK